MFCVLQVTPALEAGGVEQTTLEVAEAIVRAGGRAVVASRGGRLERELSALGGVLVRLPMDAKDPLRMLANAHALTAVARKEGASLIHARSRAPAWSALLAARHLGIPFVTTYHGVYNGRSPLKRFYNGVMARGDIVIANSDYTRAHVLRTHGVDPTRVVTIPRGADLLRFDPEVIGRDRREAAQEKMRVLAPGPLTVLAPARLTAWKGQRVALQAMAHLEARRPGAARLVFAGDAQGRLGYVRDLERMIEALRLGQSVTIAGHMADMPAALSAADIAIFPVVEPEAFGRGAVEAQLMGLPVIASALGGFTETIVDQVTGLLVPANDPAALAAAIERMMDLGPEGRARMGASGRERAQSRYSTTALQDSTLKVYRRLVAEAA